MLPPDRRTRPGNYPVLQVTVLGWTLSGRTPAFTTEHEPQHTFLLREESRLEQILNRFWEVELVEQSIMTKKQQTCEQHFISHTTQQPDGIFVSDCQQRWIPSNLDSLAYLQSEDYMQLNADWNDNQNSRFNTTIS